MASCWQRLGAVFAGGFAGTVARAELTELVAHDPGQWPWPTLMANLLATALLGYLVARPREHRGWLLGPGLCGGLSTFSTLQLELLWMVDAGHAKLALAYALVSVTVGLAIFAGVGGLARRAGPA